jgi:hypothetical protein
LCSARTDKNEKQFSGAHYRHTQGSPNGLTSNEIAERLGAAGNISSRLSELAAYGVIGKIRYRRGPRGNVYRALTDEQAAGTGRRSYAGGVFGAENG